MNASDTPNSIPAVGEGGETQIQTLRDFREGTHAKGMGSIGREDAEKEMPNKAR